MRIYNDRIPFSSIVIQQSSVQVFLSSVTVTLVSKYL